MLAVNELLVLAALVLGSMAFVACLTPVMLRAAPKLGLLDVPVARSAHGAPKPLGGGLVLATPYFILIVALALFGVRLALWPVYGACLGILIVGHIDDLRELSLKWRLPCQFAVAMVAVSFFGTAPVNFGVFELGTPWLLLPLAVLALVWLVNLYNFMDGIDGIAAGQLLFTGLACACLLSFNGEESSPATRELVLMSAVLAGSAGGFLLWNWAPASLFMGDSGSGFIGCALGLLALETIASGALSVWVWLLLLGSFIADTSVTLAVRTVRGARWYEGHSQHAYQRLARRRGSHASVVLSLLVLNVVWLFPLAWLAGVYTQYGVLFAGVGLAPLFYAAIKLGAGRGD